MKNKKRDIYTIANIILVLCGIVFVYGYAYNYVDKETISLQKKIAGVNELNKTHDIILNLQKIRGLSAIKNNSTDTLNDIKKLTLQNESIFNTLHNSPNNIKITSILQHSKRDSKTFLEYTQLIEEMLKINLSNAYSAGLFLVNDTKSFALVKNITMQLPYLIEYNGRIRGLSATIQNNNITQESKKNIEYQIYMLKELMKQMRTFQYESITINNHIIDTEQKLITFLYTNILADRNIELSARELFDNITNIIKIINTQYMEDAKKLKITLQEKLDNRNQIKIFIFLIALISMAVIIFINLYFASRIKMYIDIIEQYSITDEMTQLYNRRHFDISFQKQLRIYKRIERNFIFIMIDIDHFKQYNDTYGHQAGDNTLIAVAKVLSNSLQRETDMVFRLGGEEFGVLSVDINDVQALALANKLRVNIENLKIEHTGNSASQYVTISLGLILIHPQDQYTTDDIYKHADEALYKAKESGRNQAICFQDIADL